VPDILIRRCSVLVRRQGGWSWGPDPQALLSALVAALPRLLAQQLAGRWPGDADARLTEPITIRLSASLSALLPTTNLSSHEEWRAAVERVIEPQIAAALDGHVTRAIEPVSAAPVRPVATSWLEPPLPDGALFERMLVEFMRAGILEFALERLTPSVLEVWHRRLFALLRQPDRQPLDAAFDFARVQVDALRRTVADAIAAHDAAPPRSPRRQRSEIQVVVATAIQLAQPVSSPMVGAAIGLLMNGGDAYPSARTVRSQNEEASPQAAAGAEAETQPHPTGEPAAQLDDVDVQFPTALPWLALAPLAHSGLLTAVAGIFDAERIAGQLGTFAAALARKLIAARAPAGTQAWMQADAVRRCIAAFAGRGVLSDAEIVDLPRRAQPIESPLWVALQASIAQGRSAGAPLALLPDGRTGWLLFDTTDGVPIAWAPSLPGLRTAIAMFPGCALLTEPGLVRSTDRAALADVGMSPMVALRGEDVERLYASWRSFDERPAFPRLTPNGWEGLMTAFACAALAAIGAALPQDGAPSSPLDVYDAFAGFDALVQFRRAHVRVRMPLGRRHHELERAGILKPIPRVPWLGWRSIEFAGG
jgi:hypothetical protein